MRGVMTILVAGLCVSAAGAVASADGLDEAYKKEFAFLEAEKRALEERLADIEGESERRQQAARGEIEGLQAKLLALRNQADDLESDLMDVEREGGDARERADLLVETMGRAGDTLRLYGYDLAAPSRDPEVQATQIENLFKTAAMVIGKGAEIKTEEGEFFLEDGTKTAGKIARIGRIAAYGVAERAGGALAPAGGGRLKLWHEPAFETARAVVEGDDPSLLSIFLFESLEKGVERKADKTWMEVVRSGGVIAWVIVALGALAVLMMLARVMLLARAGSRTDKLAQRVGALIDQGLQEEALAYCKKAKGAAARVLTATIKNLKRERESLEDIISEAILHESPTVERFGTTILVVAAVAPLLGLLGTVTGMISTFDVITEFGTGDPKLLSGGISEALVTTELGLIVAIPTLLIGTLLSGYASGILEGMERAALQTMNRADAFKARERNPAAGPGKPRDGDKRKAPAKVKLETEGAPA